MWSHTVKTINLWKWKCWSCSFGMWRVHHSIKQSAHFLLMCLDNNFWGGNRQKAIGRIRLFRLALAIQYFQKQKKLMAKINELLCPVSLKTKKIKVTSTQLTEYILLKYLLAGCRWISCNAQRTWPQLSGGGKDNKARGHRSGEGQRRSCDLRGTCFHGNRCRHLRNPHGRNSSSGRCPDLHSGYIYCSRHCPAVHGHKYTWYFKSYTHIRSLKVLSSTWTHCRIIRWGEVKSVSSTLRQRRTWEQGLAGTQ